MWTHDFFSENYSSIKNEQKCLPLEISYMFFCTIQKIRFRYPIQKNLNCHSYRSLNTTNNKTKNLAIERRESFAFLFKSKFFNKQH